jgi:hypothetical protein
LDDAAITTIVEHTRRSTQMHPRVQIRVLGGAMARVPMAAAAFAHRDKLFMVNIMNSAPDADGFERQQPWLEEFWRAMRSRAGGGYVGFMMDEGAERARSLWRSLSARGSYESISHHSYDAWRNASKQER